MASASLYQYSGMNQRPMFINWTPYNLDLSPYRQNQELMLKMAAELGQRSQKLKEKAQDLKLPEWDYLSNDTNDAYARAIAAKEGMVSRASEVANGFALQNDKQFLGHFRDWNAVTSGAEEATWKRQHEDYKEYAERVSKVSGAQGLLFTDPYGTPVSNPNDRSQPMTVSDALWMRNYQPSQSIQQQGENVLNMRGATIGSPSEYQEGVFKSLSASGSTSVASNNAYGVLSQMAADENAGGSDRLAAAVLSQKYKSNTAQLAAGVNAMINSAGPDGRAAAFNAFSNTRAFQQGITPKEKGGTGEFLKSGEISWQEVEKAMNVENQEPALRLFKGKASFLQNFYLAPAARALTTESSEQAQLVRGGGGSGGGKDQFGKVNWMGFRNHVGHLESTDPNDPTVRTPALPESTFVIPGKKRDDGTFEAKEVTMYRDNIPPSIHSELERQLGIAKASGEQLPIDERPSFGQMFAGEIYRGLGGNKRTVDEDGDMKVESVEQQIVYLPSGEGGHGMNTYQPYYVVNVTDSEEKPGQDFIQRFGEKEIGKDAVRTLESIFVDDDEYRQAHAGRTGKGTGTGQYEQTGWPTDWFGHNATTRTVYVRIPKSHMVDGKFQYDPHLDDMLIQPGMEQAAGAQNADAFIDQYVVPR